MKSRQALAGREELRGLDWIVEQRLEHTHEVEKRERTQERLHVG